MKATQPLKLGRGWILLLSLLYLAHNDFWNWGRPELFLGLPLVLVYHVGYCIVVAAVFLGLSKSLADSDESGGNPR